MATMKIKITSAEIAFLDSLWSSKLLIEIKSLKWNFKEDIFYPRRNSNSAIIRNRKNSLDSLFLHYSMNVFKEALYTYLSVELSP